MADKQLSSFHKSRPRTGQEIRNAFLAFFAERGHLVVPSSSLIPEDPTVLLTIAGMLQFKPVFLGQKDRPAARATSSQKCIRTNDIENVGRTARHQTFFEMLGNFSFGDYFKREAIQWAWELSTNIYGLNPRNLVVSIFREDDEAEEIWREVVGVDPQKIIRMDEEDNFWAAGPTGPCGPCSEIYYDFKPDLEVDGIDLNDENRFIEFYNLVFMQYNRDSQGQLKPLETCNIDTGMGLERMAQILQGVPNNYETDLIFPLLQKAASLALVDYSKLHNTHQTSLKIIGDHTRAVIHLISDGVTASNLGRGYVLRRLLRRVIRHGRLVGIKQPFLREMGCAGIELMQVAYPDLLERRDLILQELEREENRFLETLERGEKLLSDLLATNPQKISGDDAFELYDTYGFPIELTIEIAQEHDLSVDLEGFELAMQAQRQRAKAASVSIDLTLQGELEQISQTLEETDFQGYVALDLQSLVKALLVNGKLAKRANQGDNVQIILDSTPFYGEGGGQVGDIGAIVLNKNTSSNCLIEIENVIRNQKVFVHTGIIKEGSLAVGDVVSSQVDFASRRRTQSNHTATHLLQAALKKVVNIDIAQAGSLVDFERLRFDFHFSRPIKTSELDEVESLINLWIAECHQLSIKTMSIKDAKAEGAIAMFGEKYEDIVRVVDVPGISKELCGGTHVANTSEIGLFKIISESGIAAGIRRIEAISGPCVLEYLKNRDSVVKQLSDRFKVQPNEIVDRVIALQDEVKSVSKSLLGTREELASLKIMALISEVKSVGKRQILVKRLDGIDGGSMQSGAKALMDSIGVDAAIVLGGLPDLSQENKVVFVAAFGTEIISGGFQAGKFIGEIAKLCGGGGGGRPNLAQAGARDAKELDNALLSAFEQLST